MSIDQETGRTPLDANDAAVQATGLLHKTRLAAPSDAPLFLLVHGRAGHRGVMWSFSNCLPVAANVLTPEAFLPDPNDGGCSWWLSGDATAASVGRARDTLSRFLDASLDHYSLRPQHIVAVGFSQGAALLSVLVQESPQRLAGAALLAGMVIDRPPPSTAPVTRIFMAHGTRDPVIAIDVARSGAARLVAHGYDVAFHEDDVKHKIGKTGMRELKAWCGQFTEVE